MRKTLLAFAAAAIAAAGTLAAPPDAQARSRGGAVAAGVVGGLAAGAIIGGALSQPRYHGPAYSYGYYGGPPCRIERERVWDGFRWRIQRVQVCY